MLILGSVRLSYGKKCPIRLDHPAVARNSEK